MGVDGFVCFHNIYSYIATVPAVEQWYFHLCSATLGLYVFNFVKISITELKMHPISSKISTI